jgi:shikimate kinase
MTVWLDAPLPELLARAAPRSARPLLDGRSDAEIAALLEARLPRYREADHRVRADRPLVEVVEEVYALWRG